MQSIDVNKKEKKKKIDKATIDHIMHLIRFEYKRVTIMVGIMIALIVIFFVINSIFKSSEEKASIEYGKYQNSILAEQSDKASTIKNTVIIPSDTAVDTDKLNSDIAKAESYIREWFNWKNGDEYDKARESVLNTFGKKSIMSQIFAKNSRTTVADKEYNTIDMSGLNMSVVDMKTYPIKIDDEGDNEYLSAISVDTRSKNNVTTTWTIMMTYTFDNANFITDARVYFLDNM